MTKKCFPVGRGRPPVRQLNPHTGFDGSTTAPWRKTVSIFKQPVTLVHTTSKDTKRASNEQLKRASARTAQRSSQHDDRPMPMLWARALDGLAVQHHAGDATIENQLKLADKLTPVGKVLSEQAAAAHLISALNAPETGLVSGQAAIKPVKTEEGEEKKSDAVELSTLNHTQPFVLNGNVTQHDVAAQQERVLAARRKLQEARKAMGL